MFRYFALIGEHRVVMTTASGGIYTRLCQLFPPPSESERRLGADLRFAIEDGYGEPFDSHDVRITDGQDGGVAFARSDYLVRLDAGFAVADIRVHDDYALMHAIVNAYGAILIHREWGFLLQASCLVDRNQGYLFAGKAGSGKSTVAELSFPRKVLADEIALVRVRGEAIAVCDSPFRSAIRSKGDHAFYPLRALYVLEPSLRVGQLQLKQSESMLAVLDHLFFWSRDNREALKLLRLCKELTRKVPVRRLYFQKNNLFWDAIR